MKSYALASVGLLTLLFLLAGCGSTTSSASDTLAPVVDSSSDNVENNVTPSEDTALAQDGALDSAVVSISITQEEFFPATFHVEKGTTVEWSNDDSSMHTVDFDDVMLELAPGATATKVFTTPGRFDYSCSIHPTKRGIIFVKE